MPAPTPKVGVNGFGRVGRLVCRLADAAGLSLVAINDPQMDLDYMVYTLKYDSTHGRYSGSVELGKESKLIVDGKAVAVSGERDPAKIPWSKNSAEYVVEASGLFTAMHKAKAHIDGGGCRKVIITALSPDAPMFVMGVNEADYNSSMNIVCSASCTVNALAPLLKVVHHKYNITAALVTTVHAVTARQRVLDGRSDPQDWRAGRRESGNIIPSSTGIAKAIARVLPALSGKVDGVALRVPVADVSVIDLTCRIKKGAAYDDITSYIKTASETDALQDILGYTDAQLVSSDLISSPFSCVLDAHAGLALNKNFIKLVAWYDNEFGYSSRVIDLIKYMNEQDHSLEVGGDAGGRGDRRGPGGGKGDDDCAVL